MLLKGLNALMTRNDFKLTYELKVSIILNKNLITYSLNYIPRYYDSEIKKSPT